MSALVYARLRVTDPGRWRATALAWRRWAAATGALGAELGRLAVRLRPGWQGRAADAAGVRLGGLLRRITLFRIFCWRADQVLSEFAAALARARALLDRARRRAGQAGLAIDDAGVVLSRSGPSVPGPTVPGPTMAGPVMAGPVMSGPAAMAGRGTARPGAGDQAAAVAAVAADLATAIRIAAEADATATARISGLGAGTAGPPGPDRPACTAGPAEVRRWWAGLATAERDWLIATEPGWLAGTDGIPVADRDVANRLLLDERRDQLDRSRALPGADAGRIRGLRDGLAELSARLDDDAGPRAYLVGMDLGGDGRAVVAVGDPDRARHVLSHVPGMTSDLASAGGELTRVERVVTRAAELAPAEAASGVLWLDYDAPDFLHEAASDRQAREGADGLRRFQDGLRATHDGPAAHQTVLGHSYGSVVVGTAAAGPLAADSVVFVGSPGVGVDSADRLSVPAGQVWSSTSRSDVIQYLAVSPRSLLHDLPVAAGVPVLGPALAFGTPERDLWFGHNPSDPGFGARVFTSQADGGHLGYWDRGRPALDALAGIAVGRPGVTGETR